MKQVPGLNYAALPDNIDVPAIYGVGIRSGAPAAAQAFDAFLGGDAARQVFRALGFR